MIFQWWTRIIAPAADHRQSSVHLQNGMLAKWHAGKMDCGRTRITRPTQGRPPALRGLGYNRLPDPKRRA
jgi:hypothetical protein